MRFATAKNNEFEDDYEYEIEEFEELLEPKA